MTTNSSEEIDDSIWTLEDRGAVAAEGWDLFDCIGSEGGPLQIQKFDDPDEGSPFEEDTDAWEHVVSEANLGSERHIRALAIIREVNPIEAKAIDEWIAKCGPLPGDHIEIPKGWSS